MMPPPKGAKPVLLTYPVDWDDLTADEQHAACEQMAERLMGQLGLSADRDYEP